MPNIYKMPIKVSFIHIETLRSIPIQLYKLTTYAASLIRAWHDGAKRHRLPPKGWQQNARL